MLAKLNNGLSIPFIGLGTWKSKSNEVKSAVMAAISSGYRHIDCALEYDNEKYVGEGINEMINKGLVSRNDLFITSKLWNSFHRPEDVLPSFKESLTRLNLSYIDLYLMHFPTGEDKSSKDFPDLSEEERQVEKVDYVDTWRAMEALVEKGLCKSIGVSNFNEYQLERLLENSNIPPAVNQIEVHTYFTQTNLVNFCQSKGVHVTAYSPLGSLDREEATSDDPNILHDPTMEKLASQYKRTIPQIVFRSLIQRGLSVVPKSVTPQRIECNINVFDFELAQNDMKTISSLNKNWRALDLSWMDANHRYFPFKEGYSES